MMEVTDSTVREAMVERQHLLESLRAEPAGLAWCDRHSAMADRLIKQVFNHFGGIHEVAVIATGGYGRRELSPYSDIDVTIVPGTDGSKEVDGFIRSLFQALHATFETGLKMHVGYAYRLVSDAPGLDATTRTGLLDMRLVVGSRTLFSQLGEALSSSLQVGEFVLEKIQERQAAFQRFHDTPLVVEPNLKEGAGGLRCFHCSNWLRAALGERSMKSGEAFDRVLQARNLLHMVAGKQSDVLTRGRQAELADLQSHDMYEMMSDLAVARMELHGEYVRTVERLLESRFELSPGVSAVRGEARIAPSSDGGDAAVGVGIATELGLRIEESEALPIASVTGPAAMYAISKGEATIRNLDRCGLLSSVLSELTGCRTLMPRDSAHEYTVFEHTLRVVRNLDQLRADAPLGEILASTTHREELTLAVLLHDVGKADDERPHSEVGEEIARDVGLRWGLADKSVSLVAWLVREHLTMARTIRLRDISSPQTIEEFAALVGDQERLDLLTLLTFADIAAVSDTAWTPSLEAFLLELHARTSERLSGGVSHGVDTGEKRTRLMRELKGENVSQREIEDFLKSLPTHYLASADYETVRVHLQISRRAAAGKPTVDLRPRADISASEITVSALDRPGLLSQMLGVLYALDLTLMAVRACTTESTPPVVLDVFTASFAGRPIPAATARLVETELSAVLEGRSVDDLLRKNGKDPEQRQRVFHHAFIPGDPAIIEIRAPRGRGMAYRLSRLLAEQGWNVLMARLSQWAGQGAAAFYVTGPGHAPLAAEAVERVLSSSTDILQRS